MSKKQPVQSIKKIIVGNEDENGYKITNVLAKGNEYAIYEIDHSDINYKLRVQIDGEDNDTEAIIVEKYNLVKQNYIEAKGLLYRSSNYGMMKNRVAHALASALSNPDKPDGAEFTKLIEDINKEIEAVIRNKSFYFLPSFILTIVAGIFFVCLNQWNDENNNCWIVSFVAFSSFLGGTLSILSQPKRFHFEEFKVKRYYIIAGLERIFLALIAGTIAYIILRSKFVFSQIELGDYWKFMTIIIVSAFSERFVPNMLSKIENKIHN
jgi:hypothetical protein